MNQPRVQAFFDEQTFTVSYVVSDPQSNRAAIIDPVLDYDPASGRTSTHSADRIIDYVGEAGLQAEWILETHVHADHLSAAPYIKDKIGGTTGIGAKVTAVQNTFKPVFNLPDLSTDGRQFDHLFDAGDKFSVGDIEATVIATPGHTPACVSYLIGDAVFVGDTLFMPDYGTARTDFPGGSAAQLFDSIQKLFALPDDTRMFMCHDYKAPGRDDYAWETSVAEQREQNVHISAAVDKEKFVTTRQERDATLGMPKLLLPSIQVNVRAGNLPDPEDNGTRYLKIPLNAI